MQEDELANKNNINALNGKLTPQNTHLFLKVREVITHDDVEIC